MKFRLHVIALLLFAVTFLYDLVVWGGVHALPDVGDSIAQSAEREAPLATTYIAIGGVLDSLVPPLKGFGADRLDEALADGLASIREDPTLAMEVVFGPTLNPAHRWIKITYWAAPVLLLLSLLFWVRRPRQLRTLRR